MAQAGGAKSLLEQVRRDFEDLLTTIDQRVFLDHGHSSMGSGWRPATRHAGVGSRPIPTSGHQHEARIQHGEALTAAADIHRHLDATVALLAAAALLGQPWLTERRRAQLRARPFPATWRRILRRRVPIVARLPSELQLRLKGHIRVFVAEKAFIGCQGRAIGPSPTWCGSPSRPRPACCCCRGICGRTAICASDRSPCPRENHDLGSRTRRPSCVVALAPSLRSAVARD